VRRGALLLVLACLWGPAGALANDEIVVEPEGHAPRTVHLSGLGEPDVVAREYTVSDAAGERRVPVTGHSLDRILRKARVNPYVFGDIDVLAAGGSVTLGRDEVVDADAFPDGPPVFWMEGDASHFLRPANAAGTAIRVGGGGPITIRVSRPSELEVRAEASARRVERGEPVTFTATVSGAPGDEQVDVSWYFDDGRSGSGSRLTHRFRKRGTYRVVVGATTSPDEPGADASVTVQVGEPRDGPNRTGGGTNRDSNAPDSGVGTGPSGLGSGAGAGGSGSGGSSGDGASEEGDAAAGDDTAARDEAAARQAARRRAARRRGAARRERAEQRPTPARETGSAAGDARQVSGIELADISALSSDAGRDAVRAARRGRLREEDDPGSGIPPGVWWALGGAALVGLGGWLEARGRPATRPA
jgi:PKD domain